MHHHHCGGRVGGWVTRLSVRSYRVGLYACATVAVDAWSVSRVVSRGARPVARAPTLTRRRLAQQPGPLRSQGMRTGSVASRRPRTRRGSRCASAATIHVTPHFRHTAPPASRWRVPGEVLAGSTSSSLRLESVLRTSTRWTAIRTVAETMSQATCVGRLGASRPRTSQVSM